MSFILLIIKAPASDWEWKQTMVEATFVKSNTEDGIIQNVVFIHQVDVGSHACYFN